MHGGKGSLAPLRFRELRKLGSGEDLPPSASSHLPSDGFSPRRRGAAEAPGAELSLSYEKVSGGYGQEVLLDGSRCQEHGEGKQSQRCFLPFSGHCLQCPSFQRVL